MNKFEEQDGKFKNKCEELLNLFKTKNRHYGNDYFEGGYCELERWMSIRRKIARLQAYYNNVTKDSLPDETLCDTWKDLAVYCIMELMILENKK